MYKTQPSVAKCIILVSTFHLTCGIKQQSAENESLQKVNAGTKFIFFTVKKKSLSPCCLLASIKLNAENLEGFIE